MVQFREKIPENFQDLFFEFQFLVVQFRVLAAQIYSECCFVSIPGGTIQSLLNLSISSDINRFQFLVVQFRENTKWYFNSVIEVSIPGGTIQRIANI